MPDKTDVLEDFETLESFWQFWDTHSSADYEGWMEPVEVEIELESSRIYCAISKDLLTEVRSQARQQGISTETLINLWIKEKISEFA